MWVGKKFEIIRYIANVFGMSLNLFEYYHAQCFFFEFPLLLINNHLLWLRTGWLKIEEWKMDEDGSAVGRR